MLQDVWVPIVVALIVSGIVGSIGKSLWDWATGKHKDEDDAWKQRDSHRRRADDLHEALMSHRSWCHQYHVDRETGKSISFKEMPKFPGKYRKEEQ